VYLWVVAAHRRENGGPRGDSDRHARNERERAGEAQVFGNNVTGIRFVPFHERQSSM
jgi:hypothetical protein